MSYNPSQTSLIRDYSSQIEVLKNFVKEIEDCITNDEQLNQLVSAQRSKIDEVKQLVDALRNVSPLPKVPIREILKKCGGLCWNACVKRSQRIQTEKSQSLSIFLTKLRSLACDMIDIGWLESDDTHNQGIRRNVKLIEILSKTGREWSILQDWDKAEEKFILSIHLADKVLKYLIPEDNRSALDSVQYQEDAKIIASAHLYRLENLWKSGAKDKAFNCAQSTKSFLHLVPSEINRLALLEFNFAVELHEHKDYKAAIDWLRESFSVFEMSETVGMAKDLVKQSRVLRLLSNSYIEERNVESALTCCQMANEKYRSHAGLYLQTKIFLLLNRHEEARISLLETINFPSTPIQTSISICQLSSHLKSYSCAEVGYQKLMEKCEQDQENRNLVCLSYFEFLMQYNPSPLTSTTKAKELIEKVIELNHNKEMGSIDQKILKEFHVIVWNFSVTKYKDKEIHEALCWFQIALRLIPEDDSINRAKNLRFISRCHLEVGMIDEAQMAARDAEALDPNSLYTVYESFRIALSKKDVDQAGMYLKKMTSCEDFQSDILAVAAQDAYESGNQVLAIEALENLLKTNSTLDSRDKGTVLRNICQLCKQVGEVDKLISYLNISIELLHSVGLKDMFRKNCEEEIEWFHLVSWNMALELGKTSQEWQRSYCMLKFATEFYTYKSFSVKVLETQKSCLLMRIFCLLQIGTSMLESDQVQARQKLEQTIIEIAQCKDLARKIKEVKRRQLGESMMSSNEPEQERLKKLDAINEDKAIPLLYLCEYQCKILLRAEPQELSKTVDGIRSEQSNIDVKVFKLLAYMGSYDHCSHSMYSHVSKDIVKHCIKKCLDSHRLDIVKIVSFYRMWIELCKTREESVEAYESLHSFLSSQPSDLFKDRGEHLHQLVSLIITMGWNNAVYYYKLSRFDKAESWMAMSLKLINIFRTTDQLSSFNTSLGDICQIITNGYNKILDKMRAC